MGGVSQGKVLFRAWFSRTDNWEHLYEFDSEATSNVVDVYIGYLRKKLDRPGEPSRIRTIRGRGYVLGGPS